MPGDTLVVTVVAVSRDADEMFEVQARKSSEREVLPGARGALGADVRELSD
jgi:hypothetical protein